MEHDDIISYGLIPEFAGRLPNIVGLEDLDKDDMFNILTNAKSSCITQVQRLLELDEINLQFEEQYLKDVSQIAVEKKVGARGLKSIVENSLHNIMFRAPELRQENVEEVIFNRYPKTRLEDIYFPIAVYHPINGKFFVGSINSRRKSILEFLDLLKKLQNDNYKVDIHRNWLA